MRLLVFTLTLLFCLQCKPRANPVSSLVALEQGPVSTEISFIGRIRSEKTTLVRAPIDAQLVKLHRGLGSAVAAGDLIATIEQPKDESRVTGVIQDKGHIEQIRLRRTQAQVRLATVKKELEKLGRLLKSGSIAANEIETAQVNQQMIIKEIESLDAEEKTIHETLSVRKVTSQNATRELSATGSGTITQLWIAEDQITTGMSIVKDTVIAIIEEPGQYVLKGEVVEADYVRMKIGQKVDISLIHGQSESVAGLIKSIAPMAHQDQYGIGRFDVTAAFSGGTVLRTGLEARGKITLQHKDKTARLPRSAVRQIGAEYRVSFPGKEGTQFKTVKVGLIGDQHIEIAGGLEPGQRVYLSYVEPNP